MTNRKKYDKVARPQPHRRCATCGKDYETHLEKGLPLPEFQDHAPAGLAPSGYNRASRRAMMRWRG